ncbi:MAG: hypothetical protein AMS17_16460 [Spirochaetes bacterium DG_61]|nr:MAG: hypothetical protein AMS17_16460 [Spirochaetes bacterium DG_61]
MGTPLPYRAHACQMPYSDAFFAGIAVVNSAPGEKRNYWRVESQRLVCVLKILFLCFKIDAGGFTPLAA